MDQESQVPRRTAVYVAVGTAGIPLRPSGDRVMEVEAVEHAKQTRQRQLTKPVAHVEFLKNLVAEKVAAKKLLKDIRVTDVEGIMERSKSLKKGYVRS
jgi:hypothetical protein